MKDELMKRWRAREFSGADDIIADMAIHAVPADVARWIIDIVADAQDIRAEATNALLLERLAIAESRHLPAVEPTEPGSWLIWNGDEVEPNGWGPVEVVEHENRLCIDIGEGVFEVASNYRWNGRADPRSPDPEAGQ